MQGFDERRTRAAARADREAIDPDARARELWRLQRNGIVASCEFRDDSGGRADFEVVIRQNGEILMVHHCDPGMARYFADAFKQDYALAGWTDGPQTVGQADLSYQNPTRGMSRDEACVLDRLMTWERRCVRVVNSCNGRHGTPLIKPRRLMQARAAFARLKSRIAYEMKRLQGSRTEAERRWYEPVVKEAVTHLAIPAQSRPERWAPLLDDVRSDFRHAAGQMRSLFRISKPDSQHND